MSRQNVVVHQNIFESTPDDMNVPELHASDLPLGWQVVSLAQVTHEFISGGTPSTKRQELWDGSIPWTTSAPIGENDILLDHAQRLITEQGLQDSASHLVPKGNLLVGTRVGVGKAIVNLIDVAISQDLTGVVLDPIQIYGEFVAYQFKTKRVQDFFEGRKRGTTIKGISRFDLQTLELYVPPLPEQHTIAYVLRTVQESIQTRRQELELERERKAALMEYLFTYGTRNEPLKQTEIGEIPESWHLVRLGEVAKIVSGGTPDRSKAEYWNGDIPWVKTGEIDYNVITKTEERISQKGLKNSSAKIIPAGTLLMAMYGQGITRGRVAILGIDAAINQACAAIFISSDILSGFLYHFLAQNYDKIRNLGHGANQKNLNSNLIKSIVIPILPIHEQVEIIKVLDSCDSKLAALEQEILLLEELFHALLEELMTGRLSTIPLIETE